MREYETYKDSMVEWIGEIPSHWKQSRIRYEFTVVMGQSPSSENYNDEDVGTPFLQGSSEFGKRHPTHKKSTTQITKLVPKNSLLISVRAPVGDLSTTDQQYCIGRGLCGLIPQSTVRGFEYYLLSGVPEELQSVVTGSTYDSVSTDDVKNFRVFLPPLSEQEEIVSYLNEKTSLIDEIIENKTQRIELLKEMRSSLISEVVTKGLNPNVPMKDSGVEWIGEIPSHWGHKKVKYMFSVLGGGTPSTTNPEFWSGDIPWVSPKDMKSDVIVDTEDHLSELGVQESSTTKISEGSVLLVFRSGILRHQIPVSMTSREVTINQDIKSFNSNDRRLNRYLFYLVRGSGTVLLDMWRKEGTTVESLDLRTVLDSEIPLPPPTEQEQLTSFLDEKTSMIDEEMSREIRSIGYLNEVRQSLINEVVTGKMDVRGVPTS